MSTAWRPVISPEDRTSTFGDPSYPAKPTEPGTYTVRGLWRVTEWRGKSVFRTAFIRNLWVPMGTELATWIDGDTHFMIVSVGTKDMTKWLESGQPVIITVRNKA